MHHTTRKWHSQRLWCETMTFKHISPKERGFELFSIILFNKDKIRSLEFCSKYISYRKKIPLTYYKSEWVLWGCFFSSYNEGYNHFSLAHRYHLESWWRYHLDVNKCGFNINLIQFHCFIDCDTFYNLGGLRDHCIEWHHVGAWVFNVYNFDDEQAMTTTKIPRKHAQGVL